MVECNLWCLHLFGLLECTPKHGRAYLLRPVRPMVQAHFRILTLQWTCSSTNLDSWQLNQLRTMKVGGNASATDFFTKHGGSALLSDSDTKKKYSSRVAELYKEELAKRVREDAAK